MDTDDFWVCEDCDTTYVIGDDCETCGTEFEKSSGCVFKDLGVEKPEVVMTRERLEYWRREAAEAVASSAKHATTDHIDMCLERLARETARKCAEIAEEIDGNEHCDCWTDIACHACATRAASLAILTHYGLEEL